VNASKEYHKIKDLKWIAIDSTAEEKTLSIYRDSAVEAMAKLIAPLSQIPPEDRASQPDYLGQAYMEAIESLYEAVSTNNVQRAKILLPYVFAGSVIMEDELKRETKGWADQNSIIRTIAEPTIDIVSLCGFIKLYADLFDNQEIWNLCVNKWDTLLNLPEINAGEKMQLVISMIEFADSPHWGLVINGRSNLRTSWEMVFAQIVREKESEFTMVSRNGYDIIHQHRSPLITEVVRNWDFSDASPNDVFIASYFLFRPEATELNYNDNFGRIKNFHEAVVTAQVVGA
jgi:hypothetical protein